MAATHTAERYSWRLADLKKDIMEDIEEMVGDKNILVGPIKFAIESGSGFVSKITKEYCLVERASEKAQYYTEMKVEDLIKILEYLQTNK